LPSAMRSAGRRLRGAPIYRLIPPPMGQTLYPQLMGKLLQISDSCPAGRIKVRLHPEGCFSRPDAAAKSS
jgi:hypothetical protein